MAIDFDDFEYAMPGEHLRTITYDLRTYDQRVDARFLQHERRLAELEGRLLRVERALAERETGNGNPGEDRRRRGGDPPVGRAGE